MLELILLKNSIINRENGTAGISKHCIDAFVHKRLDNHFRAGQFSISHLSFPVKSLADIASAGWRSSISRDTKSAK
jgi:hypothetical protein